jgi:hypothetical protein
MPACKEPHACSVGADSCEELMPPHAPHGLYTPDLCRRTRSGLKRSGSTATRRKRVGRLEREIGECGTSGHLHLGASFGSCYVLSPQYVIILELREHRLIVILTAGDVQRERRVIAASMRPWHLNLHCVT